MDWVTSQLVVSGMQPLENENEEQKVPGEKFDIQVPEAEMARASLLVGKNANSLEGMHCNAKYLPLLQDQLELLFENHGGR